MSSALSAPASIIRCAADSLPEKLHTPPRTHMGSRASAFPRRAIVSSAGPAGNDSPSRTPTRSMN